MIRPGNVAWLADAYRNTHRSDLARTVVADRHVDFTREECAAALAEVTAEARAALVVLEERARHSADPVLAQGYALLELPDAELQELYEAGVLDELLRVLGVEE